MTGIYAPGAAAFILFLLCSLSSFAASAADLSTEGAPPNAAADKVDRDEVIRKLEDRLEELEKTVRELKERDSEKASGPNAGEERAAPGVQLGPEEQKEQEQLIRSAFERTLIERGGLLLSAYTFELEPGVSYVHSSTDRVVIEGFSILPVLVVGDIFSERVRRDSFLASMTLRMGLPWDFQAEAMLPYRFERQMVLTADNKEINEDVDGFGDLELALSRQLYRSTGEVPDILASIRWKTRTGTDPYRPGAQDTLSTGTGFDSFQGTLTAVKVVDPVVLFGSLSYTYNAKGVKPVGVIKPGDSYGAQLGMAIALNLYTSISFSYDQRFTEHTTIDGSDVPGTYLTTGTFSTGMTYSLSDAASIDVSIGVGLTQDAPDVQFNLSAPIRF